MYKYVIFLFISLGAVVCSANDAYDYSLNPQRLQTAMAGCPNVEPATGMSCEALNQIALHVNKLAYELRLDPQQYGKTILNLQQTIAKQVQQPESEAMLLKNKEELKERIAIIKWLESPES